MLLLCVLSGLLGSMRLLLGMLGLCLLLLLLLQHHFTLSLHYLLLLVLVLEVCLVLLRVDTRRNSRLRWWLLVLLRRHAWLLLVMRSYRSTFKCLLRRRDLLDLCWLHFYFRRWRRGWQTVKR